MKVIKRNGKEQDVKFDKITTRLRKLGTKNIAPDVVALQVLAGLYDGITSAEIDTLSAEVAISMITENTDYEKLATKIVASNIQKSTQPTFVGAMKLLHGDGLLSDEVWKASTNPLVNKAIVSRRDYSINYFGLKTLEKGYLQSTKAGILVETPQYLYMRVALGIWPDNIPEAISVYNDLSTGKYTHATPTLFNAGTRKPQMSSCFLVGMKEDSIDGIYDTIKTCARISKWAGGIGLHIHNIRGNNSIIRGTNGKSDGIIPMLRVINSTARYVNQAGKRKGSIAVYIEPWHCDIFEFLDLRLNQGDEESRCRDLFTALWIPDLFMKRVQEKGKWSLFCPDTCKGLSDTWGEEFEKLYVAYEDDGLATKTVDAHSVWMAMLRSQTETGTPYMMYKDACNRKSNQQNLGCIKSSNLCVEIVEFTSPEEVAVCNLASISLPAMMTKGDAVDYNLLWNTAIRVTMNLNEVIDRNFYPVPEAELSNKKHRPIGVGVQGLADVFIKCGVAFDSREASEINKRIFETIYHGCLTASNRLAKDKGTSYSSFEGSPASRGILQFDMWDDVTLTRSDWDSLKEDIAKHGLYNSLLVAPMPTASTSQILGNNECIEPYTTNIYLRRTLAGEFVVVNRHLVKELQELGIWDADLKNQIIRDNGSVQSIREIPEGVKVKYKTVWEISQKVIIDMARDRGAFICQSQSLNLFVENPTTSKISSMHMYAWKQGLKTGMYYLRTKARARAQQFTIDPDSCTSCGA